MVALDNPSTLSKSNIGNSLTDQLDSDIRAAGKYTLLERSALEEIEKELNLGQSDLANAKTFAAKGGLKGADFLLIGKISQYTYHETVSQRTEWTANGAQAVAYYNHIASVRIDIRVADPKTGEDVQSLSGQGNAQTSSTVSFNAQWNYYVSSQGQGNFADLQSMLTDAANQAMQNAVSQLNDIEPDLEAYMAKASVGSAVSSIGTGKILAHIEGSQYVIGLPSTSNLKLGDRFNIIDEVPIRNSRGVVVYSEKKTIGALEVTDISQNDRAMAKLVSSSQPGDSSVQPKEGDTLVFDEQYGKSLRGSVAPASAGAGGGAGSGGAAAQNYVERGDRLMANQEYSAALDQYRQALGVDPNDGSILAKKSVAEIGVNDFTDAEDDAVKAVADGGAVTFGAYHIHAFGHCVGTLTVQKGKLSYEPTTGNDEFKVTSKADISLSQSTFMQQGSIPELLIDVREGNGKKHRYTMVIPMFLTATGQSGIGVPPFQASGDATEKTGRLDGIIAGLIQTSLP